MANLTWVEIPASELRLGDVYKYRGDEVTFIRLELHTHEHNITPHISAWWVASTYGRPEVYRDFWPADLVCVGRPDPTVVTTDERWWVADEPLSIVLVHSERCLSGPYATLADAKEELQRIERMRTPQDAWSVKDGYTPAAPSEPPPAPASATAKQVKLGKRQTKLLKETTDAVLIGRAHPDYEAAKRLVALGYFSVGATYKDAVNFYITPTGRAALAAQNGSAK